LFLGIVNYKYFQMKDPNSFGVHYILRRRNGDNAAVYAKISVNGCAREISMRHSVKIADWESIKGLVKTSTLQSRRLNHELEEQRAKIMRCYTEIRDSGNLLTADAVKGKYLGYDNPVPKRTLLLLMEEYEKDQRPTLAPGSWKNYHTTYQYLRQFLTDQIAAKDVLLAKITHKFLFDFRDYIKDHPALQGKPATQNGLAKHVERVKRMISWSKEREWISANPVEAFKTPKKKAIRGFLEESELTLIEQCPISDPKIGYVRDLFVFSCYTGISYAELISLTKKNLVHSADGSSWINSHRAKTNTHYIVPLLNKPISILTKYKVDHPYGRLFRYVSNQEMNRMLKLISQFCNLGTSLTFHRARHTFATIVTLAKGVPLESISSMLGHTKITTTQIYAKIVAERVKEDMAELQRRLNLSGNTQ
jgi:site-specific recombinase XerD